MTVSFVIAALFAVLTLFAVMASFRLETSPGSGAVLIVTAWVTEQFRRLTALTVHMLVTARQVALYVPMNAGHLRHARHETSGATRRLAVVPDGVLGVCKHAAFLPQRV